MLRPFGGGIGACILRHAADGADLSVLANSAGAGDASPAGQITQRKAVEQRQRKV